MRMAPVPTIQQSIVAKKYVPKELHSNVMILLNKMLREEASHIEKLGEYHSTVISSISVGDTFEFCTNKIATPKKITKENLSKGTSTIKLSNTKFDIDNSTGEISTLKSVPKEKCKELLEECNNTIKNLISNFNSEKITKNKIGLRGLIG